MKNLTKVIKWLEDQIEYEEWTFTSCADELGQWYDKWDQGHCEAQGYSEGHSEGYIKGLSEAIKLLKNIK
tara:strand:- start:685 stop:894 length:210 start_codon:yes stop_codon:yes gene_type:complete